MTLRTAAIIACVLDAAVWALVAFEMFLSGSDPATSGIDAAAGYVVTALFLATVVPALALIAFGRAPRTALTLALAFPVVFAGLFTAAIVVFA
jgi:hypothetical protein